MKYSEAEKQAYKAKISQLVKTVGKMTEAEREDLAKRLPMMTPEGHPLSLHNHALLYLQSSGLGFTPTIVGGFQQWRRNGRIVREGQHSFGVIWVPLVKKNKDGKPETVPPDEIRFRLVPVFDISQTIELNTN